MIKVLNINYLILTVQLYFPYIVSLRPTPYIPYSPYTPFYSHYSQLQLNIHHQINSSNNTQL